MGVYVVVVGVDLCWLDGGGVVGVGFVWDWLVVVVVFVWYEWLGFVYVWYVLVVVG